MLHRRQSPLLSGRRAAVHRVGATQLAALGVAAELGRALFCSLALGLGARTASQGPQAAWAWLAGPVGLAAAIGLAAWLAASGQPRAE
jgi:hypothetical protein